jgi:hypothetical protein
MNPPTVPGHLARFPKDQPMHTTTTDALTSLGSAGGSRRRPLGRRAASTLTALAAVAAAVLGLAAAPALADDCPNAALRAQNNSTQLPDCRAYEQVSPVFKEGFSPAPTGFTDDGRLAFLSNGNYANNGNGAAANPGGNMYLATRGAGGWVTKGLAPHGPDYYVETYGDGTSIWNVAFSSDLRSSLWVMRRGDQSNAVRDVYVRRPDDSFTRIGSALGAATFQHAASQVASDDLSHVAFSIFHGGSYEYVGTGNDEARRVDVDNAGQPLTSGPECDRTTVGRYDGTFHHAISSDGRVIFLTCADVNDAPHSVYARVDGTTTIAVSGSQCTRAPSDPGGACDAPAGSVIQGASADGTRVYFTTSQQLVNGDTDDTNDLYECDIPAGTLAPVGSINPCPGLHQVSGAAADANVQGVTRLSEDGSRAYFVATGVLASNTGANDASAVAGDDNLYVWTRSAAHPGGETRFVAKLDPADGVWGSDPVAGRLAQTTDDGRYLVFASYAALIDHGPQADTDGARDIYRYDAETGALTRLSTGVDGQGGNEPGADASFTVIVDRPSVPTLHVTRTAMSDDAASVVFNTTEALAPSDTNGTIDVYLWREGRVSLISSGKPSDDSRFLVNSDPLGAGVPNNLTLISPSGRDVYFTTTARMVSSDTDTVFDIYDARVDGGFDLATAPVCSGDACQGTPGAPPPPTTPGSTSSPGQQTGVQTTPAFTVGKLSTSQLKRVVSTGKVSLSVTTNAPGVLSARATATVAQRPSTVGSAKRAAARAGTVSLTLTVSKKARAELKRKGKLTVKVLVSQDNVAIARTVSLKLTQPKAAKKKTKKASRTTSRRAAAKGDRS